jgi:hypothetical protein
MVKKNRILVSVCTRGRYQDYLSMSLMSLALQTRKPDHVRVYDDNNNPKDLRENKVYWYLFNLFAQKGIGFDVVFGQKKGQHFNDHLANHSGFDLIFRFDDDEIAEPDCLEKLEAQMTDDVGAVGCLVLKPPYYKLPDGADNKIDDLGLQNIQWFEFEGVREVEHLHSSFLYRAGIVDFDLRLSQVSFRGETMFSHSLFLKGYKLLVEPKARIYHFQAPGGCRTVEEDLKRQELYNHDQFLFEKWLEFKKSGKKIYVLNGGLGDNYMFRQAITPESDALIATCYPDVFPEYKVISIAEAELLVDIKDYDVYIWCSRNNWTGHLIDAYKKMYENINSQRKS